MPVTGSGWELHIERLGIHSRGSRKRTFGRYQIYRDGKPDESLKGFTCERIGPGDNAVAGNGKRIAEGRYPLWTQFGRYRSIGYSLDPHGEGLDPMPGLLLGGTGNRTGILIHPAHLPGLFLSSIGCINPTRMLDGPEDMAFWDSRSRVIAMIEDLRRFAPRAFSSETMTRIAGAWVVIEGEPSRALEKNTPVGMHELSAPFELPATLPISKKAAQQCASWLLTHFGPQLQEAVAGKTYGVEVLCAIVCQETAYKWLDWTDRHDPSVILGRCVFDASGDYPGTSRRPFPQNTAAFRAKYGDEFTAMLIEEANISRRMQGWQDAQWVYKGYGIFQYDLQKVQRDKGFFAERKWYSFDECLARCRDELDDNLASNGNDLWAAVRSYNGSGRTAENYMRNVQVFAQYCAEVVGA